MKNADGTSSRRRGPRAWHGPAILLSTSLLLGGLLELVVRGAVDDGMNFNLEMWKYARDIKQRSSNPLIGHEHRPHASSFLMGVEVATNSFGHRDTEVPIARTPGTKRIVMLGDSFIEGWGVRFDETICQRLERRFRADGQPVEVMSTGVGNYNAVMEVEAFLERDRAFAPDLVVLNYTMNDAEPVPSYGSPGFLARHSQAFVFLVGGMDSAFRLSGVRQPWQQYYLGLYEKPGWQAAQRAIGKLASYARGEHRGLMIVNWPELHDVQSYPLMAITQRIRSVAEREQLPFVDLLEAVKNETSSKLWVTPPDPHPNGYANQLYAEYLYPFLKRELERAAP